jgi:hypothetical protein
VDRQAHPDHQHGGCRKWQKRKRPTLTGSICHILFSDLIWTAVDGIALNALRCSDCPKFRAACRVAETGRSYRFNDSAAVGMLEFSMEAFRRFVRTRTLGHFETFDRMTQIAENGERLLNSGHHRNRSIALGFEGTLRWRNKSASVSLVLDRLSGNSGWQPKQ